MRNFFISLSVSALLFASSSILSQTADYTSDRNTALGKHGFANARATTALTDKITKDTKKGATLVLAKVNTESQDKKHQPSNELPEILPQHPLQNQKANLETPEQIITTETVDTTYFSDEELAHLRQLFLQAENALKIKDNAQYFLLADQLKTYPLYPYLQYHWLKKHLSSERQIKYFLKEHPSSRYAKKLKRKWLYSLAKRKQWPLFLEFYSTTSETKLNCYYHRAQFNTDKKQAALQGAKNLWAVGKSQPRECDPLFSQLRKSKLFTQDLHWQRFNAALRNNKVSLASYIRNIMPKEQHATAQLWLNLHRNPSRYIPIFLNQPKTAQAPLMFRHAIDRLARKDIVKAIAIWDANKQRFSLDRTLAEKLERRLAMKLVFERETGAYQRLEQLNNHSNSSRTWRVRTALIEQNWPNVLTAIHALNSDEKLKEKWQYWLARAYMETNKVEMAQALLTELSTKRSFYGFLAADKVNSLYQLSDNPVNVTQEEITALKNRREFHVAFELMVLEKKNEAKLQWWHATKKLNKKEIIIAAKLAQKWQWDEIAIFTIAKAKVWDDIEMRFPLSYADKVHKNSAQQKINPAILFGLIRRESAFNEKAHSPVGARGLMQIMPRTGRQIARHFNERWRGNRSLYNPSTNLKYGSYYYQKLLTQFDGHYALALAAYNAGPERVKKWLPETQALPADIWIETIPFHETREYVSTVLAYALIYQQRIQSDKLSMNDFTRDVLPLNATP
jgi:soluble lytic murein transglycosylase